MNEAARAVLEAMRPSPGNLNIRWDCRTDGCYRDQLPDWSPLNDCFPRPGIRVSDIDGMVEVGGHFLFLEWKLPRAPVPDGQHRALLRLSTLPGVTVIILWGQSTAKPEHWQILNDGHAALPAPVTFDEWHAFTCAWATAADETPTSSRLVPPRPQQQGRTPENLVPNLVPVPIRDEGDEGRGDADEPPRIDPSGRGAGRTTNPQETR